MSDVFVRPRSVKISMSMVDYRNDPKDTMAYHVESNVSQEAISMATIPILKHTMEKMTKQLYAEFEKKQKETK